jgi:hypothetical protein
MVVVVLVASIVADTLLHRWRSPNKDEIQKAAQTVLTDIERQTAKAKDVIRWMDGTDQGSGRSPQFSVDVWEVRRDILEQSMPEEELPPVREFYNAVDRLVDEAGNQKMILIKSPDEEDQIDLHQPGGSLRTDIVQELRPRLAKVADKREDAAQAIEGLSRAPSSLEDRLTSFFSSDTEP